MLSYGIWFSAPSFWMGDGLESRCVGRVYGADFAVPPKWKIYGLKFRELLFLGY